MPQNNTESPRKRYFVYLQNVQDRKRGALPQKLPYPVIKSDIIINFCYDFKYRRQTVDEILNVNSSTVENILYLVQMVYIRGDISDTTSTIYKVVR